MAITPSLRGRGVRQCRLGDDWWSWESVKGLGGQRVGPMMGDTPLGVLLRGFDCGVSAFFGRADPCPHGLHLYTRFCGSTSCVQGGGGVRWLGSVRHRARERLKGRGAGGEAELCNCPAPWRSPRSSPRTGSSASSMGPAVSSQCSTRRSLKLQIWAGL